MIFVLAAGSNTFRSNVSIMIPVSCKFIQLIVMFFKSKGFHTMFPSRIYLSLSRSFCMLYSVLNRNRANDRTVGHFCLRSVLYFVLLMKQELPVSEHVCYSE